MPGTTLDTNSHNLNLNADANLIHVYENDGGDFAATTSAGLQLEQRSVDSIYIVSRNLISGQSNVDQGTHVSLTESRRRIRDRGFYLQEEVVFLDETVTLVGGLRGDQSSVNGDPDRLFFYPKAAAAYRLAQPTSFLDELKLRVAYGETGNLPLYGQKFTPLNATQTIDGQLGLVGRGIIGDPDIKPERQREVEAGVDLVGFGDRLNVELTVYQRNITDLLLERTPAPSTGASTEYFNGGELRNRGVAAG
jgi:outer membrane receptor protein involved in Fe transport